MPKVFICYRREDSTHQAGRIYDQLALHFGKSELFKDVDNRHVGLDYRRVLSEQVAKCEVLLALIGDGWLNATDANGARRLEDPSDFVRIEIESALRRDDILVVPVLVGKAPLPKPGELPETLHDLPFREAVPVRPDPDFHRDVERLVEGICNGLGIPVPPEGPPKPSAAGTRATDAVESGRAATLGEHSRRYVEKVLKSTSDNGRDASSGGPVLPTTGAQLPGTIRIGILRSGNATYVNEIETALLASLENRLKPWRVRLAPSKDCVEWGEESQWPASVSRLLSRGDRMGFHFLVAVGTQAAVALHRSLGREFGKTPTLLLGVTYPRVAGLVDSEHFRCEKRQITCVRYGCGLDAVASLLHHRIFPGRKLCFVFQGGVPQDEMAHDELATTRLAREGTLELLRLSKGVQAGDLADKDTVYFSWYTFTRLFHEHEFSILKDRLTVSIMQDNVRDGVAVVGVGTDHDWIGRRGAALIAEHYTATSDCKPDWGSREVIISPLVYWLNRTLAKKRGIEFSKVVLDRARDIRLKVAKDSCHWRKPFRGSY